MNQTLFVVFCTQDKKQWTIPLSLMRQEFATTVRFFLQALDESAADAVAAIDRLTELHEKTRFS